MYRYRRLLVGLDLSGGDKATIEYAAMVSRMAQSETVYFVHVANSSLDLPDAVRDEYPDLLKPVGEHAKAQMVELVDAHFSGHQDAQRHYEVVEASPLAEILSLVRQKDIDLVLVGRKAEGRVSGALSEKLARKAPCSVLIIPEATQPRITKVLVPVDFSEHSRDAIEMAVVFALASDLQDISCLHVYSVPIGYGKTGKTYEEFGEIMRTHAEQNYRAFIGNRDLRRLTAIPIFALDNRPAKAIKRIVEERQADLLVIGERGRGAATAVLLGCLTERLIQSTTIPLLAVKKKRAGLSILTALLGRSEGYHETAR